MEVMAVMTVMKPTVILLQICVNSVSANPVSPVDRVEISALLWRSRSFSENSVFCDPGLRRGDESGRDALTP